MKALRLTLLLPVALFSRLLFSAQRCGVASVFRAAVVVPFDCSRPWNFACLVSSSFSRSTFWPLADPTCALFWCFCNNCMQLSQLCVASSQAKQQKNIFLLLLNSSCSYLSPDLCRCCGSSLTRATLYRPAGLPKRLAGKLHPRVRSGHSGSENAGSCSVMPERAQPLCAKAGRQELKSTCMPCLIAFFFRDL